MGTTLNHPKTVRELVIRTTTDAWENHAQGVFLARLGAEIAKFPETASIELAGRTLSGFIKSELAEEVQILAPPGDPLTQVVFPRSAEIDEKNIRQHIVNADPLRKAVQTSKITGAILIAFTRRIEPGFKRVIYLEPKVRFEDIPLSAPVPSDARVLDAQWVVAGGEVTAEKKSLQVMSNITAWRKSIDLDAKAIIKPPAERHVGSRTLLDELLSTLSESDQKRIQLPLDVVAKLQSRILK